MGIHDDDIELRRGAIGLVVLAMLDEGPAHGYQLTRRIRTQTGQALSVSEGAVYPILHRFENNGLVESEWGRTSRNRRAKIYRITVQGREHMNRRAVQWRTLATVMNDILSYQRHNPGGQVT